MVLAHARMNRLRTHLDWIIYYHVKRRAEYALISFVWKLPRKIVYWCVIRAACEAEPREYPGEKTAVELLKAME